MNFFEILSDNKNKLTSIEYDVLNWINQNKKEIIEKNIGEIARLNNVSISMINKSLKKLNISGIKELKLLIVREIHLEDILNEQENSDFLIEQRIYVNNIIDTSSQLDNKLINKVSENINSSEQNLLWGEGFMRWVGKDFQRKVNKIQKNFRTISDLENLKYINLEANTNLIILTVSGSTPSLEKVIEMTRSSVKNLKITAITASSHFKWKTLVDYHIFGQYTPFIDIYEKEIPTSSRMVITYIMDIIFHRLFFLNGKKNINNIKKLSAFY